MPVLTGPPGPQGTWRMQEMSFAYVKAVAAAADCAVDEVRVDRDSVDLGLRWKANAGVFRSPRLEVQAKSTHQRCIYGDHVRYALKKKNYEELADTGLTVPKILVVFVMPRNIEDWVSHSEDELALRRCAYWMSLYGYPPIGERRSRIVHVPRNQVFDVPGLHGIWRRLSVGERP